MKKKFIVVLDGFTMDDAIHYLGDNTTTVYEIDDKRNIEIRSGLQSDEEGFYCGKDNFYFCTNAMELGKYIEKGYGKAENACVFSNSFPFLKMDVEMYFMLCSGRIIKSPDDDSMKISAIATNVEEREAVIADEVNESTSFIKEKCKRIREDEAGKTDVKDEDVNQAIPEQYIRTELDLIANIMKSNNLEGPVEKVILNRDKVKFEFVDGEKVNNFLTKVLNDIVMNDDEELRYTESYFPCEEDPFSYKLYLKNGIINRTEEGEFSISSL